MRKVRASSGSVSGGDQACNGHPLVGVGQADSAVVAHPAPWHPLAEKQTPSAQPRLLPDSSAGSAEGTREPHGVGVGCSSTSLMQAEKTQLSLGPG